MVRPILDKACLECHGKGDPFELTPRHAFDRLLAYANNDLRKLVFEKDYSTAGTGPALDSKLLAFLESDPEHESVTLSPEERSRLYAWMDTYAQRQGSFSEEQEKDLAALRQKLAPELFEKP